MIGNPGTRRRIGGVLGMLGSVAVLTAQDRAPFTPFDRAAFEAHVVQHGASAAQLRAFSDHCADRPIGEAADALLRALFPAFDAAVVLARAGDPRAPLTLAELLASTSDPYVRAHCRYHLGRALLEADDPERAVQAFASFLRDDRNRTPLDGEVLYLFSSALAQLPSPPEAIAGFRMFLDGFPDAPERHRVSAAQRIAELQSEVDSPLHGIADAMKGVERRIRRTDTGAETQRRQEEVMEELQELIAESEQQEQQASGTPNPANPPNRPAERSVLGTGEARVGNLGRNHGVADRWGDVQDRDRQAIESDLQTKLPGHYRRMLEEYYKRLGAGER